MKKTKKNTIILLAALLTLCFSACERFQGDVQVPAYLHLDRVNIVPQSQNAPSVEPGFYTANIDAVQIIYYFEGDPSEYSLGVFQLPFTVPLLRHGNITRLTIVPVIKQNGIAGTRIAYPYYNTVKLENIRVAPDSITNIGRLDPQNNQWYINANYKTGDLINIQTEDYFEPTAFSSNFDSTVIWVKNDPNNACTGQGYGRIHINDSTTVTTFSILKELSPDPKSVLYLEMDYKNDFEIFVNMVGFPVSSSGQVETKSIQKLHPRSNWNKIYINLGRVWEQFNHNTPLSIFFQVTNPDHKTGDIFIDNVKIIAI